MFAIILDKYYAKVAHLEKDNMLQKFKGYDKGEYGSNDKKKVLEPFFEEFPPKYTLAQHSIQDFWNHYFPQCFSITQNTINIVNRIQQDMKLAIITNGSTKRQKAKIMNTHLQNLLI